MRIFPFSQLDSPLPLISLAVQAVLRVVESCLVAWRWPHCRARDAILSDGAAHVVRLQHLTTSGANCHRTSCNVAVLVDCDGWSDKEAAASVKRVVCAQAGEGEFI